VGNTFNSGTNVNNTHSPQKATAYYNIILGNQGSSGVVLNGSGLTICERFHFGWVVVTSPLGRPNKQHLAARSLMQLDLATASNLPPPHVFDWRIQSSFRCSGACCKQHSYRDWHGCWRLDENRRHFETSMRQAQCKFTGRSAGHRRKPGFCQSDQLIAPPPAHRSPRRFAVTNALTINNGASLGRDGIDHLHVVHHPIRP